MKVNELFEAKVVSWDKKKLGIKEAINYLNANCKDGLKAIANGSVLFRGFANENIKKITFIDTSKSVRTSRDTNNLYQLMMDTSEALAEYPKRSASLICTTDINKASSFSSYNGPMVVIPVDGTNLAVSSVRDIFNLILPVRKYVSEYVSLGIENFSGDLGRFLIKVFGIKKAGYPFESLSKIDKAMAKVSAEKALDFWFASYYENIKSLDYKKLTAGQKEVYEIFKNNPTKRFSSISSLIMTPETTKISLVKFGSELPAQKEVWFSGKAMIIPIDIFYDILTEMKKLGLEVDSTLAKRVKSYLK